jgi:hypothetical protein
VRSVTLSFIALAGTDFRPSIPTCIHSVSKVPPLPCPFLRLDPPDSSGLCVGQVNFRCNTVFVSFVIHCALAIMAQQLCQLPDELLIVIAEHLEQEAEALRHFSLTSKRFQAIVEPILYRNIFFRFGSQLPRLLNAVADQPRRRKGIHTLDIRCGFEERGRTSARPYVAIGRLLRLAQNTRDLTIESPYCQNTLWEAATVVNGFDDALHEWLGPIVEAALPCASGPSARPLQALKRVTLHLNGVGREFWTLDRDFSAILVHPTIEHLHLSSINVPSSATEGLPTDVHTPLKHLILDEANVTFSGLRGMLAIPKALEHLYVGMHCNTVPSQHFEC